MLRALMLHEVGGEVDHTDVVAVDEGGALEGTVELVEELAQPGGLCHAVGHSTRPQRWSERRRANAWPPKRQGWRPGTRRNRRWTGACWDSQPSQCRCRPRAPTSGWSEKEVVVEGAAEVAQNPLERGEMGLPRSVHMQAHLLDDVCDVGPGEGEVLEHAGQAPVGRRVGDRRPVVLRELCLSVDRRGAGPAVRHASPLQDVDGVLALVEEETLGPTLGGDAEEVV
jgi:hypothetical protein